jgi:hypothetical protein
MISVVLRTKFLADFGWYCDSWQLEEIQPAEDINRNNFVDMPDAALFAQEWLLEQ